MLSTTQVSYQFPHRSRSAVSEVSATWEPGKLYGVVGPNGSGKSTLLRLLSGEVEPTSGSVKLQGKHVSAWTRTELAQIRAMLPQTPGLEFGFTVREVVEMGRHPFPDKINLHRASLIVEQAIRETHLEPLMTRNYLELSRGEKQRVHLARVHAQILGDSIEQRVLLLDEPVNHLDLAQQHINLELAAKRAQEGALVIAVLHDLNLALSYLDEVILLHQGQVVANGKTGDVLEPNLIRQVFGIETESVQTQSGQRFLAIQRASEV